MSLGVERRNRCHLADLVIEWLQILAVEVATLGLGTHWASQGAGYLAWAMDREMACNRCLDGLRPNQSSQALQFFNS